jgi:hypothetical protein
MVKKECTTLKRDDDNNRRVVTAMTVPKTNDLITEVRKTNVCIWRGSSVVLYFLKSKVEREWSFCFHETRDTMW